MMTPRLLRVVAVVGPAAILALAATVAPQPSRSDSIRQITALPGGEKISFRSHVFGEDRTIQVRLPEGYGNTTSRFPVLYVLDGEYFFEQAASAVQFLSELGYESGQHPIPEMIVVGVVNVDRDRDYTPTYAPEQSQGRLSFPTSGGAAAFQDFLERELFPLVEARYRTSYRVLSGWSLGGLFTVNTYLRRPDLFARYLAISPSLWWDESVAVKETRHRIANGDTLPRKRLVITLGAMEGGDMDGAVRRGFVPLFTAQPPTSVDFTFLEIAGESHGHVPYKAYFDGLSALFSDWIVPGDVMQRGLPAVEDFFHELSHRCGYPVDIPLAVYRTLSTTLPDIKPALAAARQGVARYPDASVAYLSLGRLQQMAGDTAAAVASLERALKLELERRVPQSERLKAIRGRLDRLRPRKD